MHWGLIPHWTQDRAKLPSMINARCETVATRPAYRDPFRTRRCLILADGFYEWQPAVGLGRRKIPHWISLPDREPFAMAGLWDEWRPRNSTDPTPLRSCTIITIPASPELEKIHDRMPAILCAEAESLWLDADDSSSSKALEALLASSLGERLRAHPVSPRVNSSRNEGPELIELYDEPSLGF